MSPSPPFTLSRCTTDDLAELLDLQYACFPASVRLMFMGCNTPAQPGELQHIRESYAELMRKDPHDIWIAVRDTSTGRIIAGANWKVYMNGEADDRKAEEPPSWLEGEELAASQRIIDRFESLRRKAMPDPFIHLHICFTDDAYRRRGAGAMMMQWGCDLADLLALPGYIEASEDGNHLYKTFGFHDHERTMGAEGIEGVTMKRDAKASPLREGGKAAPS
ncbi:hypothetical protein LTR53_006393 [Teratosphaeriaceae sp. CCFEE 6253]|nr:hypothetical protein LTR53_006393 [Teratosphaeriaceae sp. CCFEE 6253]